VETPKGLLQTITRTILKGLAGGLASLFGALQTAPGHVKEGFSEAKIGLRSADWPTRRMSIVFYLSLVGVGFTFYGFGKYVMASRARQSVIQAELDRAESEAKEKAEELRKSRLPPPYQTLGTFSLELRETEGVVRSSGLRAAEMEIVIACSELEACEWVKANLDRARGEMGPLFTPTDREKIMSPGGKRAFREEIRDTLNHLLEEKKVKGTIIEVLFPRFIVS